MPMKRHKPEQIVTLLRQIEVETANGKTTPQACRDAQITVQTFYRWRKEYGGLKLNQAKRLKELEKENAKLKRVVAELSLEKQILKDASSGKLLSPERRRAVVELTRRKYGVSERYACRVLQQWRGTQRYLPMHRTDEDVLTPSDDCPGDRVWPLRLPEDHDGVAQSRLAGGQGSRTAHLAAGGGESTAETEATRAVCG